MDTKIMKLSFRTAALDDVSAIIALFEKELQRQANHTYIHEAVLNHPSALAFDDDVLIGFTYCGYMAPDVLELANILVAKEYRNHSIGMDLLKYTEQLASIKAQAILLTNSALYGTQNGKRNAENFYLNNGYTQIRMTDSTNFYWKSLTNLR